MHGEEIRGIVYLADQGQFLIDAGDDLGGRTLGIAPQQALTREPFQPGLGRFAVLRLIGVLIAQLVQAETAAGGDIQRAAQRGGVSVKEPRHFCARFQTTLAIGQAVRADFINGDAEAQAGQHIGQGAAGGAVHQHIAHRHHGQAGGLADLSQRIQPGLIAPIIARGGAQMGKTRKATGDLHQISLRGRGRQRIRWQGDQHHALPPIQKIGTGQVTFALGRTAFAQGQKPRQPGIGGNVGGQRQPVHGTIGQHQPRADDEAGQGLHYGHRGFGGMSLPTGGIGARLRADGCAMLGRLLGQAAQFLERRMGPHHPGQRIAVGDGDGGKAQFGGAGDQFLGVGGPGEEGEIGGHAELGIRGGVAPVATPIRSGPRLPQSIWAKMKMGGRCHANSPWAYQPGDCGVWNSHRRGPSQVSIRQ